MTPQFVKIFLRTHLAIELDDASHARPERIERDEFVDRVFKTAGLPLLHVPAQANYSLRMLSELLNPYLPPVKGKPSCLPCGTSEIFPRSVQKTRQVAALELRAGDSGTAP